MDTQNTYPAIDSAAKIKRFALVLCAVAAIAIGAKIQVPFWPVPMTLQTLAIFTVAASLGLRLGVLAIFGYLALGLSGVSVFAGLGAGPLYMAGPTAGFLVGFVVMVFIIGAVKSAGWLSSPLRHFFVFVIADVACLALGLLWLAYGFVLPSTGSAMGVSAALAVGVTPFILGDLLKAAVGAVGIEAVTLTARKIKARLQW
tara:strand:- start:2135 stop:2737 length:603 start_codon:yes stop_codon:yes gene_type:complete